MIEIRYKGRKEYPKNYHDVFSELNDLTIEAKDAFYEEQSSFWVLVLYHLNQPYITVYHKITDYYFDQFSCLYKEVHTYDTKSCEVCQ